MVTEYEWTSKQCDLPGEWTSRGLVEITDCSRETVACDRTTSPYDVTTQRDCYRAVAAAAETRSALNDSLPVMGNIE